MADRERTNLDLQLIVSNQSPALKIGVTQVFINSSGTLAVENKLVDTRCIDTCVTGFMRFTCSNTINRTDEQHFQHAWKNFLVSSKI